MVWCFLIRFEWGESSTWCQKGGWGTALRAGRVALARGVRGRAGRATRAAWRGYQNASWRAERALARLSERSLEASSQRAP
jgi:hypothetical protein